MTASTEVSIKNTFTKKEIEAMKGEHRETIRFQIEGEDGKAKFNAYRLRAEDGLAFCNRECNTIFEKYSGKLILRVFTRISNVAYKEIAYAERTKEIGFDELLLIEE